MDYKGCVVVQGPTYPHWIEKIKDSWKGYQIIYSTWDTANPNSYEETDIVIYNKVPKDSGVKNLNLQKVSTINGLQKAKELGWERALKVRSDLTTTTADGLFGLFDNTKLNLHAYWEKYINDFYMEGEIDDLINLFSVPTKGHYPEWHLTKRLYSTGLNKKSICVVNRLEKDVADIYWEKAEYWFSEHVDSDVASDVLPENWKF